MENRAKWDDSEFKKIEDIADNGELYYILGPKPKIPLVNRRDFISKMYDREDYFLNSDETPNPFLQTRVEGGEHADYPVKKGITRGKDIFLGQVMEVNAAINGVKMICVLHRDMQGSLPDFALKKGAEKAPMKLYTALDKFFRSK